MYPTIYDLLFFSDQASVETGRQQFCVKLGGKVVSRTRLRISGDGDEDEDQRAQAKLVTEMCGLDTGWQKVLGARGN